MFNYWMELYSETKTKAKGKGISPRALEYAHLLIKNAIEYREKSLTAEEASKKGTYACKAALKITEAIQILEQNTGSMRNISTDTTTAYNSGTGKNKNPKVPEGKG